MVKKYRVKLSSEERQELEEITQKNKKASRAKIVNAFTLLKADEGEYGEYWKDEDIAKSYNVSVLKVERLRKRLVEEGLEAALNRKPRTRNKPRKIQGEEEAHLIAIVCGPTPEGHAKWTLRLLASKMVELQYFDSISPETIRQTLKKRNQTLAEERMVHSA